MTTPSFLLYMRPSTNSGQSLSMVASVKSVVVSSVVPVG